MSFCWCFSGNAGGYVRPASGTKPGPFILNIGFAIAPRSSTSSRSCFASPAPSARATPSLNATIIDPMIMFTTSFMRAPAPVSPK